jgi:hypothetical protein
MSAPSVGMLLVAVAAGAIQTNSIPTLDGTPSTVPAWRGTGTIGQVGTTTQAVFRPSGIPSCHQRCSGDTIGPGKLQPASVTIRRAGAIECRSKPFGQDRARSGAHRVSHPRRPQAAIPMIPKAGPPHQDLPRIPTQVKNQGKAHAPQACAYVRRSWTASDSNRRPAVGRSFRTGTLDGSWRADQTSGPTLRNELSPEPSAGGEVSGFRLGRHGRSPAGVKGTMLAAPATSIPRDLPRRTRACARGWRSIGG